MVPHILSLPLPLTLPLSISYLTNPYAYTLTHTVDATLTFSLLPFSSAPPLPFLFLLIISFPFFPIPSLLQQCCHLQQRPRSETSPEALSTPPLGPFLPLLHNSLHLQGSHGARFRGQIHGPPPPSPHPTQRTHHTHHTT